MAIRLNLLAELQAAEDMRRRDPVKRSIWIGASLAVVMLAWSTSLQLKAMIAKRELSKTEDQMGAFKTEYGQVMENKRKGDEIQHKVSALEQLTAQRFLQANVLNAMQVATVDDVQLLRYRSEQLYAMTDGIKPKTNGDHVTPGKPATVTERVTVTLEGNDSSPNPGDQVTKFKEAVANNSYFKEALGGRQNAVSLKSLGQPEFSSSGRRGVYFTLECRYPEITR
jgi:hypothetical protein